MQTVLERPTCHIWPVLERPTTEEMSSETAAKPTRPPRDAEEGNGCAEPTAADGDAAASAVVEDSRRETRRRSDVARAAARAAMAPESCRESLRVSCWRAMVA
eukprot:2843026-Prymnesium_polylepis.1